MNKKSLVAIILVAVLMFSMTMTTFAQSKIFIDLVEVKTDTPSQIINDRTMVPVRAITEMLGYDVNWIESKKQVEVCESGSTIPVIIMQIDNNVAYYSKYEPELGDYVGNEIILDSPATLIYNRTFVPLRFISEAVGYTVDYNVDTADVYMFSPAYTDNQKGEGIGNDSQSLTTKDMQRVLDTTTNSWLKMTDKEKKEIATLINRWWFEYEGYEPADINEMIEVVDHQMEQYFKNSVDEGVFQTVCDIYGIDISKYIQG
ncbi:MAG: copper amine oxidase N-terminal domain-containing protein [Eubacteriales bacterium]|nr:copper amine oxidase N-terminal domain-containing protein [Eubacteriales bacterium]